MLDGAETQYMVNSDPSTSLQFPLKDYYNDLQSLQAMGKEEVVAMLRRSSTGFSRGASKYRGVTRHHQHGKWEARIGRVAGNKYLVSISHIVTHVAT